MIDIKTPEEIHIMTEGGKRLGDILQALLAMANCGVSLLAIEKKANELIARAGGTPSFTTVADYQWATCLCVNDVIVHGIPKEYILKQGDIITIDVGILYQGYHTDTAWTKYIQGTASDSLIPENAKPTDEIDTFLRVGEETLWKAIDKARVGNRIGHISQTIQQGIEGAGYHVVRSLVGHGVGKILHEDPQVPGILRGKVEHTLPLKVGMTLAIEVIYAQTTSAMGYDADGWTIRTKDGSLASVYEHTIVITENGPTVLTKV